MVMEDTGASADLLRISVNWIVRSGTEAIIWSSSKQILPINKFNFKPAKLEYD